ncbi:methyltransferase [Amycolatopsis samaneae]|uniref:Methyltransferase n=1 Tax=Amycolatopsis samaneae TaxID=664691 RepID=A0ABW5GP46_9PSEU
MTSSANALLRRKLMGFVLTQAIHAVVETGVIDRLAAGPATVAQLAAASGTDPDALARFLRLLGTEGVLAGDPGGTYTLTELGELLRRDVPGSLRHFASMMVGESYLAWQAAEHTLRTGEPAFDNVFGTAMFSWLAEHPEEEARFTAAQAGLVRLRAAPLLDYEWSDIRTVVDVGGGNGGLLALLLADRPGLCGVLLDLPHVVARASGTLAEAGVADRCECVGGDFFEAVPAGADAYLLAEILHDWNDTKAVELLRLCREAMPKSARLLILEQVAHEDGSRWDDLLDLHMLVMVGGRERDRKAWHSLLGEAGFVITDVRGGARSSLIEARPG